MIGQNKVLWSAIITLSIGLIFVGAAVWMTPHRSCKPMPTPNTTNG